MEEKLEKFKSLLKEIFEVDKSDLNFGIYKIINLRKDKVENFIDSTLPREINKFLDTIKDKNKASELASDIYSALYNFFSRYYDEGDFISKRRYKEGVYAIPYEGEEVKLYWANYDQYYIKTSEDFKDYEFKTADGITCKFRLVDVTTEQNNNKEKDDEKRKFMLYEKGDSDDESIETFSYDSENKILTISFIYDIPKDKNAHTKTEDLEEDIRKWVESNASDIMLNVFELQRTNEKKQKTLLEKHLEAYIAKNTFDYFIHKDLKGFLDRELDFFIKSEIMHLEDLNTDNEKQLDSYLLKVKAIKRVGEIVVDFLASVENFQKKLWLKKKFIIETNWCISLDKIDESFYDEIRNNKAQVDEWIDLYAINEVEGFTDIPSIEFLKKNTNLIIDTINFANDFKERLLATINDLDKNTNGLLINGDNFHAIRLLNKKYKKNIKGIYIDPPYNASTTEIMYKNGYKDSSWLSLMNDRIDESIKLMDENSKYVIAIDENEDKQLGLQLKNKFHNKHIVSVACMHNPRGIQGNNFSYCHETYYFVHPQKSGTIKPKKLEKASYEKFRNWGGNSPRKLGYPMFYPIFFKKDETGNYIFDYIETAPDKDFHPESDNIFEKDTLIIWPIDNEKIERKWRYSKDSAERLIAKNKKFLICEKVGEHYQVKFLKETEQYKTCWIDEKYDASNYGSKILNSMFKEQCFTFPKSIYTVIDSIRAIDEGNGVYLDYFAGSGTTANAIIELNKEDNVNRKYILVEMGNYFSTALKPRIKKSYFCKFDNWNNGKPKDYYTGISSMFKYSLVESYEDALSNITLNNSASTLFPDNINYMMDLDTKDSLLNIDKFKLPFDYKMRITAKNETKETNIDIVETFNYLIGLTVRNQYAVRYFKKSSVTNKPYEGGITLEEIAYDKINDDTFKIKEIHGLLPDGRKAAIIWRDIHDDLTISNAVLDAFYITYIKNKDFDILYINGDNNVQNLKKDNENWKVEMIEPLFNKLMFEEE